MRFLNTLESIENKADHMENIISKLEEKNIKMVQAEEEQELRFF